MDIVTYALAKAYVKKTADALGAVRGAPCTIKSIVEGEEYNTVTFEWTGDSGAKQTRSMKVYNGENAPVITDITIGADNHLIFTFDDGTTVDCGEVSTVAKLTNSLTATTEIGSVTYGKTYATGTELETIIRDILIEYTPPAVTLSITPSATLYDIVTDSISTILEKAVVTKKTNPVTKVSFYVDDTEVNSVTSGVASGGTFQYQYTPVTPINTDVVFKATATDGKQTSTSSITVKFVGRSYYGICDADVSDPDETVIKSGSNVLKDTKAYTYSGINMDYNKVFYAYPKSFGDLSKIYDPVNNLVYTNDFQKNYLQIDGIDYVVYCQIQPSRAIDVTLQFS